MVQVAFDLNKYVSVFVEGGYGFVFGKPVEQRDITFAVKAGKDEVYKTLRNQDMKIQGGLAALGFTNSAGRMFSSVKTEVSLQEGWRVFAGFNYSPDPALFVSFSVGLKEYKVSVDVTRDQFCYPCSTQYAGFELKDFYLMKPAKKLRFDKNIYPLALRATFGAVVAGMHVFSVGIEYVSTKADLNASGQDSTKNADSSSSKKDDKKESTVYAETYVKPFNDLLAGNAEFSVSDFSNRPSRFHMTDPDTVVVKHATQVELQDIALSLGYQLKI